ncbi:MAG: hypothetical protein ABL857_03375 [Rickettsiales bacterium]|jgi:hypothetical protein
MSASMNTGGSIEKRVSSLRERLNKSMTDASDRFNQFASKANVDKAINEPSPSGSLRQALQRIQMATREEDAVPSSITSGVPLRKRSTAIV